MYKSLKAKIHSKRSKSSSRMADSEEERSRDVPVSETENSQHAAEVALPPEDEENREDEGEDGEKQSKRAILGEYLYVPTQAILFSPVPCSDYWF